MSFKDLHLINPIIRAVTEAGYSKPTAVQEQTIPLILSGQDVAACAPERSGKTSAFIMPALQLLKKNAPEHQEIRALILAPTAELVTGIEDHCKQYSKYLPLSQLSIFEGESASSQLAALRKRVDLLIATPGRLLELLNQRKINLARIELFILDEADKMTDPVTFEEIRKILPLIPGKRQTLLFSQMMTTGMRNIADSLLKRPVQVLINTGKASQAIQDPGDKERRAFRIQAVTSSL